jgi:molybdopterin-containing oxidoreductase family iron-sulfur binding subunit
VFALAQAMNAALGNVGQTVTYIDPVEIDPVEHVQSIRELADDLRGGKVQTLVVMGGNPVFDAPADVQFKDALEKFASNQENQLIQLAFYRNDTTDFATWHVPEAHYLESWGDVRSYDGTVSIVQPMIAPLFDGHTAGELVAIFTDQAGTSGHELVQSYWRSQHPGDDFESWWRRALHDGFIANSAFTGRQVTAKAGALPAPAGQTGGVEIVFRPDPTIFDGTFVNNA